jgi:hypothetical protein
MSKEIELKDYRHLMVSLFEMKEAASVKEPRAWPCSGSNRLGLFLLDCTHVATGKTSKGVQFSKRRDPGLNAHKCRRHPANRA